MNKHDAEYFNDCLTEHYEDLPIDGKIRYIKSILQGDDACTVTFQKVNGDVRNMLCTLNPIMVPEEHHPGRMGNKRKESETTVAAFDLEAQGWRSFRVENVTYLGIAEPKMVI